VTSTERLPCRLKAVVEAMVAATSAKITEPHPCRNFMAGRQNIRLVRVIEHDTGQNIILSQKKILSELLLTLLVRRGRRPCPTDLFEEASFDRRGHKNRCG
jgi:hypothetical protein